MDEKSADPLKNPNNKSSPFNQMKAILTTDGFIKIIYSTDELKLGIKEKFLSKDATLINVAKESTSSSSAESKRTPIDLRNVCHDESENNEDYSHNFKQTPRQVYMSTVCHVSLLIRADSD